MIEQLKEDLISLRDSLADERPVFTPSQFDNTLSRAIATVDRLVAEHEFNAKFTSRTWLEYLPEELPEEMKPWLCTYVQQKADAKLYGLNSIDQRRQFVRELLLDLSILT